MDSAKVGERCYVYIPQEITEQILPHLPVKSLLRFRCVSKSWRSLIDSREFMNKHLEYSTRRGGILDDNSCDCDDHDHDPWWPIDDPINNHMKTGDIIGCCNGVLCMLVLLEESRFYLWNPATRICTQLPNVEFAQYCGFGWDEQSGAYKVFSGMYNGRQGIGKLYSSTTNSWKTIEGHKFYLSSNDGVFACGKIHWISACRYYIASLDLKSEVFRIIELPLQPERAACWLRERNGCLYVLYNNNDDDNRRRRRDEADLLDVWVMGEYGVKDSWMKIDTIPIPSIDCDSPTPKFVCNRKTTVSCTQQYFYVQTLFSPSGIESEGN